jgi:segregation and condensation protein B
MEKYMTDEHQETLDNERQSQDDELQLPAEGIESLRMEQEDPSESDIEEQALAGRDTEFSEPEIENPVESEIPEQALEEDESDWPESEPEQEDSFEHDMEETSESSDELQDTGEGELTVESVIEAVLFASDEPLTTARLANIVEVTPKQVREHIKNLNGKYRANHNAFRIEQIAGGYQMLTLSSYNHWLKQLLRVRSETKLSPAALETLAIIAYKQPVIRADIEAIRGVAVGEVIRSLSYKGLVKIVGRAEVLGRPMLYGTTKKFLEVFGLNSLKDLPKIEELKKPRD